MISIGTRKRHQRERHPRWHEQLQEARSIVHKAVNHDDANHKKRQRAGHRDLTRHRECVRNEPDEIAEQHEQEKRENEGKETHSVMGARHVEWWT